jgi:MOSC domain-containing protein YiiM
MKIISTNLGSETTIAWKGKKIQTGIVKTPVEGAVFLDVYAVRGDHINNKKVHGGIDKACYGFGENYYNFWKELYPTLNWTYGMFGENLTISNLDESKILIGDIYRIGDAIIQVSQPRQPCNTFAAKFGSTDIIRQFIDFDHPGAYFRVIQAGKVMAGDELKLDLRNDKALSVQQIFRLLYARKEIVNETMAREALFDSNLSASVKKEIQRQWKLEYS